MSVSTLVCAHVSLYTQACFFLVTKQARLAPKHLLISAVLYAGSHQRPANKEFSLWIVAVCTTQKYTQAFADGWCVVCRFSTETSQSSGFALWIYAVPTTSNSTRLIINAGLNPSKAFAPKPDAKLDFAQVKQQAVRTLFSLRPRYAFCNAHGTVHSMPHDPLVYAFSETHSVPHSSLPKQKAVHTLPTDGQVQCALL